MDGRGITFSGAMVKEHHTLAVDPEVIPLGSLVYIPYFKDCPNEGWFVAQDTGSAIKEKRIDVYMPSREDALNFGVRTLDIYVLPPRQARPH
jgi:3D (Asp-Asp-Asp) domain-containing protein